MHAQTHMHEAHGNACTQMITQHMQHILHYLGAQMFAVHIQSYIHVCTFTHSLTLAAQMHMPITYKEVTCTCNTHTYTRAKTPNPAKHIYTQELMNTHCTLIADIFYMYLFSVFTHTCTFVEARGQLRGSFLSDHVDSRN